MFSKIEGRKTRHRAESVPVRDSLQSDPENAHAPSARNRRTSVCTSACRLPCSLIVIPAASAGAPYPDWQRHQSRARGHSRRPSPAAYPAGGACTAALWREDTEIGHSPETPEKFFAAFSQRGRLHGLASMAAPRLGLALFSAWWR